MRLVVWITVLLIKIGTVDSRLTKHQASDNDIVEKHRRKLIQTDDEDGISGSYIVHFTDSITDEEVEQNAKQLAAATGGKIFWIYKEIFKGFAISGLDTDDHIASILGRDDVEVMEQVCVFADDDNASQFCRSTTYYLIDYVLLRIYLFASTIWSFFLMKAIGITYRLEMMYRMVWIELIKMNYH